MILDLVNLHSAFAVGIIPVVGHESVVAIDLQLVLLVTFQLAIMGFSFDTLKGGHLHFFEDSLILINIYGVSGVI